MTRTAKIVGLILVILAILYLLSTIFLAGRIDRSYNTVSVKAPYQHSDRALRLLDSIRFIADLHCDALLWDRNLLKEHNYGAVDIPRMLRGGMGLQAFTIVTKVPKGMNYTSNTGETDQLTLPFILAGRPMRSWFDLSQRTLVQCMALHDFARKSEGRFEVIETKADFKNYLSKRHANPNITAGFLGIEGLQALEADLENIDRFYQAGVRMMAPVHFFDTELGGSAHGVSKGGLTPFGKKAIRRMQELDILVDVAHASEAMIDDILRISQKPIINSHTGVQATCKSVRNLSDKHIRQIAAGGGLIGIGMFEGATCDDTPASTARAIKHVIDLVGADYVAFGSDFDGAVRTHTDVTGLKLYVDEMLQLGISEADIHKVMGENVKNFVLQNFPD